MLCSEKGSQTKNSIVDSKKITISSMQKYTERHSGSFSALHTDVSQLNLVHSTSIGFFSSTLRKSSDHVWGI